jgi:hypothetical protein
MTSYALPPARGHAGHGADTALSRPAELALFALLVANAVYLAASFLQGSWILRPDGTGILTDFVTIWSAGKLALAGHAAAAYDWEVLQYTDQLTIGRPLDAYLAWPYPPPFLLVSAVLALLPYVSAFFVWIFGTFALYLVAVRAVVGERIGYALAAAYPVVLANFIVGQNGFLSAALIGGALVLLDRRPILAGVLLGLLTYKPHLGLLFPLALAVSGRWRVFGVAAVTGLLIAAVSFAAFGADAWHAFFVSTGRTMGADSWADWGKLQSISGVVRALGGGERLAWIAQLCTIGIAGVVVASLWRGRAAYELKAAGLATATLFAAPHLLIYDLVILAIPLGYLIRLGRAEGFRRYELYGMGLACALAVLYPFVEAPIGFGAMLIVAVLIAQRALWPAVGSRSHGIAPRNLGPEAAVLR